MKLFMNYLLKNEKLHIFNYFPETHRLRNLGRTYFLYLFIYSGLEFTLTFLTHYSFGFTRMQQGWMFLGIGTTMAVLQGGWVRHIPEQKTKAITELVCIGI